MAQASGTEAGSHYIWLVTIITKKRPRIHTAFYLTKMDLYEGDTDEKCFGLVKEMCEIQNIDINSVKSWKVGRCKRRFLAELAINAVSDDA